MVSKYSQYDGKNEKLKLKEMKRKKKPLNGHILGPWVICATLELAYSTQMHGFY